MVLRTKEIGKLYYHIGDVSDMFSVNASTIRFWESEFPSIKPKRNKKGTRLYTENDLSHLRLIHHLLKEKGFTLEGAKLELKKNRKVHEQYDAFQGLQKVKKFLTELRDQL